MRKFCLFALPCCAMILVACLVLPLSFLLPAGIVLLAVGIIGCCLKWQRLGLIFLGLALGLLWLRGYTFIFRDPAQALAGQTVHFSATITDWPCETAIGGIQVEGRLHLHEAPNPKVLFYTDSSGISLQPGDIISGQAQFQLTQFVRGEQVTYYEARGLYLRASTTDTLTTNRPERLPLTAWPAHIAHAMQSSVNHIFPADTAGLINALLTGDRAGLSESDYTALEHSGLSHIVSVSGLHLTFFSGFLGLFFRRRSKLGALLTLAFVFLFCAVTGFPPSVMRAAFMITVTRLAPLVDREDDPPTTLTSALFILLMLNPYSAMSVSLQLSFASIAGIHFVSKPLHRAMTRHLPTEGSLLCRSICRVWSVISANLSVTLGALLFTTPLTALYFGTVSIISPLTNLLVLWAVSLAFTPGLVLTILGIALPGLSSVMTFPVTLLIRYILFISRTLGRLSFSSLSMNSGYICAWLVLLYLLLAAVFLSRRKRPIVPVCAGIISLCAALLLSRSSVLSYPLSITMLDVGQGQSVLLCSDGYTALVDCGGTKDNAGDIAADYLNSLGISKLDLLVLTHCHNDHANGVPELLSRVDVSNLILPDLLKDESTYRSEILSIANQCGTEVTLLSENRCLSFGDARITLYAPLGDGGSNEEGLSALVTCEDFDLLITGDANAFVESLLIKYNDLPDIEILIAGHHGSKNSTSIELLDNLKPETCLISVGYNTYGHPADETLVRLTEYNTNIYRTDLMGHLTVRCKGD